MPKQAVGQRVAAVRVRGNRRIEDAAIRAVLRTRPGRALDADAVRADARAIWRLGFFDDVRVEVSDTERGPVVVFALVEKPSIRRIYLAGNDAVSVADINRVLDLRREQILDRTQVRANAEKIRNLYQQRGYLLAEVDDEIRSAADDAVDVYFRIGEGAQLFVREVRFAGNAALSDRELREVIVTRERDLLSPVTGRGTFKQDVFERDLVLLQAAYLDRGFINAKGGEPAVEISPDLRSVVVTIPVDEGMQYRAGRIDVSGDLPERRSALLGGMQLEPGDLFSRSMLSREIERLLGLFRNRGYAYANVTPQTAVNEAARRVDVTFEMERGPRVAIERIEIRGNERTSEKVIRRELRIAEGEVFNQDLIELSRRRIIALGYFQTVDVSTRRGSTDRRMVLTIEVSERSTGTFQLNAGFSSVERFVLQGQIAQHNFLGRGQTLSLQAQLSGLRRLFLFHFQDPYFLDTPWTFGVSAYNQQRSYVSFIRASVGGNVTLGYWITDTLRALVTYTVEDVDVSRRRGGLFLAGPTSPVPQGVLGSLLRSGITSAPQVQLIYDTRDNRLFTTRGWHNSASVEVADPIFSSDNTFIRAQAGIRYFRPLWGPFVFRHRFETGLVTSRAPEGVPLFERYFLGGIFDIRGFRPRSLGPRIRVPSLAQPGTALVEFPIGGNLQVITNTELEFAIVRALALRGVVFVDVGNALNLEDQYCRLRPAGVDVAEDPCADLLPLRSLRASWGFGVRWFSPLGPLRFEWGIPFRALPGEERVVFEFTIGNTF